MNKVKQKINVSLAFLGSKYMDMGHAVTFHAVAKLVIDIGITD